MHIKEALRVEMSHKDQKANRDHRLWQWQEYNLNGNMRTVFSGPLRILIQVNPDFLCSQDEIHFHSQ